MANSDRTIDTPFGPVTDLVSYEILVDGGVLEEDVLIQSIKIDKKLNSIARAYIEILDGNPENMEFPNIDSGKYEPGKSVEIKLGYHSQIDTVFKGIVLKTGIKTETGDHTLLVLECVDEAYKMTLKRNSAYFLKKKDSDIINQIIGNHSVSSGKIDATPHQHKEVIQYQSTDWDFIMARAEINGLVVVNDQNKLSVKKPDFDGEKKIVLTFGMDVYKSDLVIDAQTQLKTVECTSWDQSKQKLLKGVSKEPSINSQGEDTGLGKKLAGDFFPDPFTLHTSGPEEEAVLKEWANAQLLKSRMSFIRGTIEFQGSTEVNIDNLVQLDGFSNYFNGYGYVSAVTHVVEEGNFMTEVALGTPADWFTETAPNIEIPPAAGLLPGIEGLYIGTVKKIESDPDGETRIQVDIPVIEPSGDGVWARLSNPYATNNAGWFFIPEVGDEVILGFMTNDPRYPVILGSLYSTKLKPPYTPDKKNSVKAIVTNNQLKVIFEDEDKNIIIETPSKNKITISDKDKSITIEDQNKNKIVMDNKGILLDTVKDINLKAKGNITLDATQKVTIKAKMDLALDGMNVKAKAKVSAEIQGTMAKLAGNAQTEIKGGLVRIN